MLSVRYSPFSRRTAVPTSAPSSSPSSDSDDPDGNYVAMTTSNLSFSTGESVSNTFSPLSFLPIASKLVTFHVQLIYVWLLLHDQSLRLMLHRASEGGVSSSPLLRRARSDKPVEYLDLDLHTGRATPTRQVTSLSLSYFHLNMHMQI